ncbi:MAG: Antifreeze glycopeptide polyprotein precursor [Alphaproteobacteria bacterium]|jgi:hypothetical protein|nr:Antifreeze glycopeptide polyprotein precursor [Alphaproteobacteria bacterium]
MTGFRADPSALALLLALAAMPALAQQPIQLVPPPQPLGQPAASPAASPQQPSQRLQDFYGGPVQSGGQLSPVDNAAIGIVETVASGLPGDMWRGTDRGAAIQLLDAMPGAPRSRILRDLQFRLLTTIANPPLGANPPGQDFVATRIGKLSDMGEIEAVGQMTQAAGPMSGDAAQRLNIENQLIAGDAKAACNTPMTQGSSDPFWTKLMIVCHVIAGQNAQAMLNVDLLRERGVADTGFFVAVDYALGTRSTKPPANIGTDTLSQALLRASNPKAGGTLGNETTPAQLRQIAANVAAPLAQRIEAAERGEALGVIDPRQLLELYQAGADAPGLSPQAKRRAQAVRDAVRAGDVGDKVKAMQAAFRAAEGSALFTTMARVLGEQLVKIYPEHKTAPMAADTARAMLALNDFPRAVEWYYTVAGGATIDPQYEAPTVQLWPVLQLADNVGSIPWEPGFMAKWQAQNARHPRAAQRAAVLAALLPALGEPVDRAEFNPAPATGFAAPPQQALARLAQSAQQGRVAAAVALAAQAAGETPLTQLAPATLSGIVQALRQIGLQDVARRFAVEVVLAHAL